MSGRSPLRGEVELRRVLAFLSRFTSFGECATECATDRLQPPDNDTEPPCENDKARFFASVYRTWNSSRLTTPARSRRYFSFLALAFCIISFASRSKSGRPFARVFPPLPVMGSLPRIITISRKRYCTVYPWYSRRSAGKGVAASVDKPTYP